MYYMQSWRLRIHTSQEQLGSDEGMWLCKRMRAENVLVAILKSRLATQLNV